MKPSHHLLVVLEKLDGLAFIALVEADQFETLVNEPRAFDVLALEVAVVAVHGRMLKVEFLEGWLRVQENLEIVPELFLAEEDLNALLIEDFVFSLG